MSGNSFRIIFSIWLDLGRLEDGSSLDRALPFDRDGHSKYLRSRRQFRAVDLHVGDEILCDGRWRRIEANSAYRDAWLTAEQALRRQDEGYVYRPMSAPPARVHPRVS